MAVDLFIDGKRCDLPVGTVIAMSYATNFIGEFIAPTGSNSNQFNLPKTQQNTDIFETAQSINSDTDVPYRKLPVRLLQNGRELISAGFAVVNETAQFFKVVVYGGNLDFFEEIKGKELRDLDLSEFDHIWNFANVANSRGFTEGFIYPIIDWNEDEAFMDNLTNKVDPRTLFHAMFVHTIVTKIFEDAGFNKTGNILNDAGYLEMVVPVVDSLVSDTLKADRKTIAQRVFPNASESFVSSPSTTLTFAITMPDTSLGDVYGFWTQKNFPTDFGTFNTFGYTSQATTKYSIKFRTKIISTGPTGSVEVWQVKPSGTRTILISINIPGPTSFTSSDETEVELEEGDNILVMLVVIGSGTIFVTDPRIQIEPISNRNIYNTLISAGDNLPDMSQTDFIKSIARIFGIIFQTNSFTKTVEFRQFKDIKGNIPNAVNWTKKLDKNTTNKEATISYHAKGYARRNILKWTNDKSLTLNDELGEGVIIIKDESLPEEKVLIQIPFSATEMTKKLLNLDVPIIKFLKLGVPKGGVKPRMLIMNRTSDVTIEYNDTIDAGTAGNNIPLCYFILDTETFNLGFDNSLIDDNYDDFNLFLDKYKKLGAFYLLDENDIADLDFLTPVYDDNYKHYFFISKLDKFIEGRSTRTELIRL